jgi:hypothetical protein
MVDERLLGSDQFLLKLIVTVMQNERAMTAAEIAKAVSKRSVWKLDRRSVEAMLKSVQAGW